MVLLLYNITIIRKSRHMTKKSRRNHGAAITYSQAMVKEASMPVLHADEGFLSQPTYHGFWGQTIDSFEGLPTQLKCSYSAMPYGYYMGYIRLYKECNMNL